MDWIQFLQIICVPAFGWFFYKLGEQRREIKSVERETHIARLETKIDDLREMIWSLHHEPNPTKRHSKQ